MEVVYYILLYPILFMGLRLWIKTKKDPVFTLHTQWQYLNQSLDMMVKFCYLIGEQ